MTVHHTRYQSGPNGDFFRKLRKWPSCYDWRKWPSCYDWRGMAYTFWRKWPRCYDWRGMAYTFWQGKAVRTPSDSSANNIAIVSSYKCRSVLSTLFIYVSLRMFVRHTLKSSVTGMGEGCRWAGVVVGGVGCSWMEGSNLRLIYLDTIL